MPKGQKGTPRKSGIEKAVRNTQQSGGTKQQPPKQPGKGARPGK